MQAARLLEPGGPIFADVFESDLERPWVGTRAMLVVDRRRMREILDATGLAPEPVARSEWSAPGSPRIDRVLRRLVAPAR